MIIVESYSSENPTLAQIEELEQQIEVSLPEDYLNLNCLLGQGQSIWSSDIHRVDLCFS